MPTQRSSAKQIILSKELPSECCPKTKAKAGDKVMVSIALPFNTG